ncbi:hypothetical protein, partial [Pseudomonas sp.]|uniref:hypothetical protein n=1 Tax=Pseudomonas sp. TaxID=306 RepID=UPI003D10E86B
TVQASKGVEKLKDLRGFFPLNPGKDHLIPASHCLSRTKCPFTLERSGRAAAKLGEPLILDGGVLEALTLRR